jgi:hypothetical protein
LNPSQGVEIKAGDILTDQRTPFRQSIKDRLNVHCTQISFGPGFIARKGLTGKSTGKHSILLAAALFPGQIPRQFSCLRQNSLFLRTANSPTKNREFAGAELGIFAVKWVFIKISRSGPRTKIAPFREA